MTGAAPSNEMQSVGCGAHCAWDDDAAGLAMWDTHFTADAGALPGWVADVKRIIAADFWGESGDGSGSGGGDGSVGGKARPTRCLPPGYVWLRFGGGNDDFLSPDAGLHANGSVHLQMSFMTSKATAPRWGIKHGHVLEAVDQLTLCKYKGRPVS